MGLGQDGGGGPVLPQVHWFISGRSCDGPRNVRKDPRRYHSFRLLNIWDDTIIVSCAPGIIIAGFGNGKLRLFDAKEGNVMAQVCAHLGSITGLDLASHTGLLITSSEDSVLRVRFFKWSKLTQPFKQKKV